MLHCALWHQLLLAKLYLHSGNLSFTGAKVLFVSRGKRFAGKWKMCDWAVFLAFNCREFLIN